MIEKNCQKAKILLWGGPSVCR